jgi:hypothetical protein
VSRAWTRRRVLQAGSAAGLALVACQPQQATPTATASAARPPASSRPNNAFNVRDFGAKADGVTDDSKAINDAIRSAIAKGPGASVLIPSGRYLLATPTQTRGQGVYTKAAAGIDINSIGYGIKTHVLASGATGLTISGEPGTVLLMRDPSATGIYLDRCTGTVLSSIAVDYDPLPFTQGAIVAAELAARSFDFKLDSGYQPPNAGYLGQALAVGGGGFGLVYAASGDLKPVSTNALGSVPLAGITSRPDGTFRVQSTVPLSGVGPGDRFAWTGRRAASGQAVTLKLCTDCRVESVTVYSAPGLAFLPEDCDGLTFRGCVIDVPQGSGRLISANADGIHCKSNKRGPLIDSCRFTRNGDDSFTIVQLAQHVLATPSPTDLVVELDQYQLFLPGDRIAVIDQTTGQTRAEATVRDVTIVNWKGVRARQLSLDTPLAKVVSADTLGLAAPPAKPLSNDRTTPLGQRPDLVCDLDRVGGGFVIRNNVFADHYGGARVLSIDGLVENNQLTGFVGNGLLVGMDLFWPEVFDAKRVVIRNNVFSRISNAPNISVRSSLGLLTALGTGMGNQDVTIEGNTFGGFGANPAIRATNAQAVRIRGNTIGAAAGDLGPAVSLDLCRDVTIEDNTISRGPGAPDPIVLTGRTDTPSIISRNNRIVAPAR